MTDERALRQAQEHAALVVAVRRYVTELEHRTSCGCYLCEALFVVDRRPSPTSTP